MSLSAEQLDMRRHGLGASDIAAVAGINPYATAWDVYLRKVAPANETVEETDAMALGNILEEPIAQMYVRRNPSVRLVPSLTLAHPEHPWVMATPDRFVFEGDRSVRLLEVKTAGPNVARHWGKEEDGIPEAYIAQVSWQMFVTGHEVCDVAALVGGALRFYRVERNEPLIRWLFERGAAFMEILRSGGTPAMDSSDAAREYLDRQFPRENSRMRIASDSDVAIARAYAEARAEEKAAAERKTTLGNQLREAIGDDDGFSIPGAKATWKTANGRTVAWEAVARALGADADPDLIAKHSVPLGRRLYVNVK